MKYLLYILVAFSACRNHSGKEDEIAKKLAEWREKEPVAQKSWKASVDSLSRDTSLANTKEFMTRYYQAREEYARVTAAVRFYERKLKEVKTNK